jgi:hypothetical protein
MQTQQVPPGVSNLQHVIAVEWIAEGDGSRADSPADDGRQGLAAGVRDRHRMDPALALQQAEDTTSADLPVVEVATAGWVL